MPEIFEMQKVLQERWIAKEDSILRGAGYKPVRGGVWRKGGVLFSRGAALQYALGELREKGESNRFNESRVSEDPPSRLLVEGGEGLPPRAL